VTKRVQVSVSGRVQGVFYRAECAREARARGVGGHVRNMPDGSVQAVFEGDDDAVDAMVAWCRHGPEWASVDGVDVGEQSPAGEAEFRIR
jgi:acylphosphatase